MRAKLLAMTVAGLVLAGSTGPAQASRCGDGVNGGVSTEPCPPPPPPPEEDCDPRDGVNGGVFTCP